MRFLLLAIALAGCRHRHEHCVRSHEEKTVYYVQAGNVLVPVERLDTVCDEWVKDPAKH